MSANWLKTNPSGFWNNTFSSINTGKKKKSLTKKEKSVTPPAG